jgi:hypothetical protein
MSIAPESLPFDTAVEAAVPSVTSEFASTWNRHDMPRTHELDANA